MDHKNYTLQEVVDYERVTRMTGGKMRPVERVFYICKLSCGHVAEKMKEATQMTPPKRLSCKVCRSLLDDKG